MRILAFFATGSEDAEFVITVDLLRRARIEVLTVSVDDSNPVSLSHNINVTPDRILSDLGDEEIDEFDGLFLPGGKIGVSNLKKSDRLMSIIKRFNENKKLLSAICAAPTVLAHAGIMKGHKFTCYEGWQDEIDGIYEAVGAMKDENIVTGRSLNYSIDFSLLIIEYLLGSDAKEKVEKGILRREW